MFNYKRQVTFQSGVPEAPFLLRLSVRRDDKVEDDHDGFSVPTQVLNKWVTRAQLIEVRRQIDNALEEGHVALVREAGASA
jgi:hypothetical protein